jgi:hypothetical protein
MRPVQDLYIQKVATRLQKIKEKVASQQLSQGPGQQQQRQQQQQQRQQQQALQAQAAQARCPACIMI